MISSKTSAILFSFNFLFIFFPFISSTTTATQLAPALYVFGDSLFDCGNNDNLLTLAKANYYPYGIDFVDKKPGRFTNGKTVPDFIAEFLGLPFAPPYKSIYFDLPLTGLNYASAATGILPETGKSFGKRVNFEDQVGEFEDTVSSLGEQFESPEELSNYLSKSIFIIAIGNNDYFLNYLSSDTNYKYYSPQDFAKLLADKLSDQLQRLYNSGARKIVVFDIFPVGCMPSIMRKNAHEGACVEDKNQIVSVFNNMLPAMLQNLTSTLTGSSFVDAHIYPLTYDAVINPSTYGLVDVSNPCCPSLFNGTSGCIRFENPCNDADKNYFWDGYHPTEAVYTVIASRCINDTSVCTPFTLNQLVNL